jgi:hypothetical protein
MFGFVGGTVVASAMGIHEQIKNMTPEQRRVYFEALPKHEPTKKEDGDCTGLMALAFMFGLSL